MPPLSLRELESQALERSDCEQALCFLKEKIGSEPSAPALKLLAKFEKKVLRERSEKERWEKLTVHEREGWSRSFIRIAGVDEAGRGPLAGPVVAAAVILKEGAFLRGLNDSKKLAPAKREELFDPIHEKAVAVGVGRASAQEIDETNIYQAAQKAMERAILSLAVRPDYLLTDAMPLPVLSSIAQKPIIHGDSLSASIAAASVVAKVTRDRLMVELDARYPHYGFAGHKGYGTSEHMQALDRHGPCLEHRTTFAPVLETIVRRDPEGHFGYWKEQLTRAEDLKKLKLVGARIARLASSHLSETQLERLRGLFKERRSRWAS